ncbi:MAG: class I SAM-dependent methyltransferase [Planctomycetes bacterium]|nr:class I SAM-dependent methyltransferase [Planctomycetota bacterium]
MSSAKEHYERLLAPLYAWMLGGSAAALERQREFVRAQGLGGGGRALDLGAGFGATALALAESGLCVTAVDASDELCAELERSRGASSIRVVRADLVEFAANDVERYELVLCVGDTLTHLESFERVLALADALAERVAVGGRLVLGFRDLAGPAPEGAARFFHVRSDDTRTLTCFLDYRDEHVLVHDIVHERGTEGWTMRVGVYPKLRLATERVLAELERRHFELERRNVARGMTTLVLRRR